MLVSQPYTKKFQFSIVALVTLSVLILFFHIFKFTSKDGWLSSVREQKDTGETRSDAFDKVYLNHQWGAELGPVDGPMDTNSGSGSYHSNTIIARKCLSEWLVKYEIKTFFDAPCGDANWQGLIPNIKGKYSAIS